MQCLIAVGQWDVAGWGLFGEHVLRAGTVVLDERAK
jgi:hypothetical protein